MAMLLSGTAVNGLCRGFCYVISICLSEQEQTVVCQENESHNIT